MVFGWVRKAIKSNQIKSNHFSHTTQHTAREKKRKREPRRNLSLRNKKQKTLCGKDLQRKRERNKKLTKRKTKVKECCVVVVVLVVFVLGERGLKNDQEIRGCESVCWGQKGGG